MWRLTIYHGKGWFQYGTFFLHSSGCISTLGSTGSGSVGILTYQSMSALLNLGKFTTSGSLGVESFQPPFDISGRLFVSTPCFSSPSYVKVSDRTCHRSIQTSYSGGTLLDGGSVPCHNSWYVGRHSSSVSSHKKISMDVSIDWVLKGLQSLHLTLWLLRDVCCADKGFSPSVCQALVGVTQASTADANQQCWKEWKGYVLKGVAKQCHFCP